MNYSIPDPYRSALAKVAPSIHFCSSKEEDMSFRWDGDGPDPVLEGFVPCDVTVTAKAIVGGKMVIGNDCLGGCYIRPDESPGVIGGYLLQMLDSAVNDLCDTLSRQGNDSEPIREQLARARIYIGLTMRDEYDKQRAEIAAQA